MLYAPIILDQSIFIYCIIILQKIIYLFFTFLLWTLKIQDKMNDCLDTNFTLIDLKRINKLYIQEIFDYFEQLFLRKNKIALLIQCIQYCILLRLLLSLCFSLIFFYFLLSREWIILFHLCTFKQDGLYTRNISRAKYNCLSYNYV